jgi:hypothetical protein
VLRGVLNNNWPSTVWILSQEVQNRTRHVYYGEKRGTTEMFIFSYTQINQRTLSIETHVMPVQIRSALNREGVELQFNQSYQFELTTNPLGKHYINS